MPLPLLSPQSRHFWRREDDASDDCSYAALLGLLRYAGWFYAINRQQL